MATTDDTRDGSFDAVLNRDCFCITLDRTRLSSAIRQQAGEPDLVSALLADRPNLFSGGPVFLSAQDIEAMLVVVAAIEAAARTPAYQEAVLGWARPSLAGTSARAGSSWAMIFIWATAVQNSSR
ncbi:hypothetical protein [Brevundimonas diminuta]|uniref:Uncharacterized protein n=1 Tax=Brevundimonas diminuta TaxID=293 RepID=A0A2X1BWI8_BREDI|nr:hypothetical protein [Brevundimonas diminuta]SPU46071.1 Uncharacterised protein [Brevundimonas diminuta]